MTKISSIVSIIALMAGMALGGQVSAGGRAEGVGADGASIAGAAAAQAAGASLVGRCNSLAGRALGLVHRIDHGDNALCADLGALFQTFAEAGCLPLLAGGQLFLNHAVGQYELACRVFTDPAGPTSCGASLPPDSGVCPF